MENITRKIATDKKIGVLCGGMSSEKDVSMRSGKNCYEALKRLGYNNAEIKQALNGLDLSDAVSLSDAVKNALKALKKK